MTDPGLDSDTAERMLRGQHTGPPKLAGLLAAASSDLSTEDLTREEAAVAAFRVAHSGRSGQRRGRRLPALVSLKTALTGLVLLLAGGVAMAATAQHLPGPLGNDRPHPTRTPVTSNRVQTRIAPRRSARPTQQRPTQRPAHSAPSDPHSRSPQKSKAHLGRKPKGKPSTSNPHKPTPVARTAFSPSADSTNNDEPPLRP